ncbi:DUF3089 domain-containing protein [uncultured Croceitalea sp.]|uniref:DUF3089 domain-containing protein n=1 Tax=uncultured Croceitalea sp. TaxID=1798908 RepID=UPI003305CE85
MIRYPFFCLLFVCISSCKSYGPVAAFNSPKPEIVDYGNLDHWAAHPNKRDNADKIPGSDARAQVNLDADVFFVHPTIYNNKGKNLPWNPSITDSVLNARVDNSTIKFQASAFNKAGRVFAPRYRQAHLSSYTSSDSLSAKRAFEFAYNDVKSAFEHYLTYYNNGRPVIIASHSQGTTHAGPLIKEFFDGTSLQQQLVAAYLIGMPVPKNYFKSIFPCESADGLNCTISWRTFKRGHLPEDVPLGDSILVTNPLSWNIDTTHVLKVKNKGAVLRNFDKVLRRRVDAQVHNGILWANKPRFPWSFLFRRKNYHIADINFYYMNIKENAKGRVDKWLEARN